jgi:hypothetical protein
MATDRSNSDKNQPGDKNDASSSKSTGDGASMKERLLAQRRAAAEAESAGAPPVPAARPAPSGATARAQAAAAAARSTPKAEAPKAEAPKAEAPKAAAPSAASRRPVPLSAAREEERAARRGSKGASAEVMKEVEMLRKSQDKWIMYGWIVAAGMLLIAGAVYFVVHNKKVKAEQEAEAHKAKITGFMQEVLALDEKKPADNKLIIEKLNSNDDWKVEEYNSYALLSAKRGAAQRESDRLKEQNELLEGIAELEGTCGNASSKSSDDLNKARRRAVDYEVRGAELDAAIKQRLAKAHLCIDKAYVAKLHDEAKALIAKGPAEARNALAAVQKAEDEIVRALDDATKTRKDVETVTFYSDQLKSIIPEGDALVAQIFTPDVIERTPWTDLLSGEQKDKWQHPAFKGWQIKDGVLTGVGPDLDSRQTAIMSIGDQEQWRDYVCEIEFVLVKGEAKVHFRLGAAVNNSTLSLEVSTGGGAPFKAGATNLMTSTVLGSSWKVTFSDPDHSPHEEPEVPWTIRRKGGIAISVPPGAEIKITKMRIKVLR